MIGTELYSQEFKLILFRLHSNELGQSILRKLTSIMDSLPEKP